MKVLFGLAMAAFLAMPAFGEGLALTLVGEGFDAPTAIASPNDGSGRLFITEHSGTIRILQPDGTVTPFLDIKGRVYERRDHCCNEQGLLGMTFPPGTEPKTHFFISYVDRESYSTVSRFEIDEETGLANPDSEVVLQKLYHPDENHYAGTLHFHPKDNLLYWSMGDGSAGFNVIHSQVPDDPFGKILRFDPYAGPGTPLEIYAMGFRNPWKFSFDSATGDLFIGDVGENTYEELNYVPNGATPGKYNFGWGIMEGRFCYENKPCNKEGLTLPIFDFNHETDGCSITAGEMYRGSKHPEWQGRYFFGDFCFGHIWETHRESDEWVTNQLAYGTDNAISTFGRGEDGELYIANYVGGTISRIDMAMPEEEKQRARRR